MKKINFKQDFELGYEFRKKLWSELCKELQDELYGNLKLPIIIISSR